MSALLDVRDLRVRLNTDDGPLLAVGGASFTLDKGEILAIVGESGCGKSMTAKSIIDLLPHRSKKFGRIRFEGKDISSLRPKEMNALRGSDISMIFQEPMTSLNPSFTIGFQIMEVLQRHKGMRRKAALEYAVELLDKVQIPAPNKRVHDYPHQLSGGMRQRVMIAIAIACEPKILIADEPTTALDVTIQAQILDILRGLREAIDTSIIIITHNLGVVADIADKVAVMYAGQIIETAPVHELFSSPQHPYTLGLLASVPKIEGLNEEQHNRLQEIPGLVPVIREQPSACVFEPRCSRATIACKQNSPQLSKSGTDHMTACLHPGSET